MTAVGQSPTGAVKVAQKTTRRAGIAIPERTPEYGCGKCAARWGGWRTMHCAGCHRTFSGLSAFESHRAGSHPHGTRHCAHPADVGLVESGRKYECWGAEGDGSEFWNETQ